MVLSCKSQIKISWKYYSKTYLLIDFTSCIVSTLHKLSYVRTELTKTSYRTNRERKIEKECQRALARRERETSSRLLPFPGGRKTCFNKFHYFDAKTTLRINRMEFIIRHHRCAVVGNVGGSLGFGQNSFEGGTWGCQKI